MEFSNGGNTMKKNYKIIYVIFIIICSYFISQQSAISKETDIDYIIQNARQTQLKLYKEVNTTIFYAQGLYKEKNKEGKVEKEILTERRIYVNKDNKRHEEYLSMIVNGKKLNREEMEKELKDWRKRGKPQTETRMPLTPEGDGAYNFRLLGSQKVKGIDTWVIAFEPKQKKDGYVTGKGYISKDNFSVLRMEFAPAKLPKVIENINLALNYDKVENYWIPAKFEMEMKIKVGLLIDLYYKHITVEDTYSQFVLNSKIDDSIFKSES